MTANTTLAQKEILLEFMNQYPTMATNSPSDSSLGRQNINKQWEQLSESLNANGPPIKNVKAWKKTWADYKHRAKAKLAKNKNSLKQTGGGPFQEIKLTQFENAVAELGKIKAAVHGIQDAKSFDGNGKNDGDSGPRPSTSRASSNEDYFENLLDEVLSESDSASLNNNVHVKEPLMKENVPNSSKKKSMAKDSSPNQLSKLEIFKSSAHSSEEFHKKLIEILQEIRDLKKQQVDILQKQAADNLLIEKRKLCLREQEIKIAIRRNEIEEYKLGLRTN